MKNIKWGFIGCGDVVEKKSGPAFSEVEGSSVVAVMSRSEGKARSYAERHGIGRWYKDAQELIDDDEVNAVYVATPPSSHATYAIMAMKAGKPVYVEVCPRRQASLVSVHITAVSCPISRRSRRLLSVVS